MPPFIMNIDYTFHSHTYRCGHASGDIDNYVPLAIANGYRIYGVSDHVFLPGVSQPFTRGEYSCLDDYINKYLEVKKRYEKDIQMYLGFECEYSDVFVDYYKWLLKEKGFDYLICGQHCGFDNNKDFYSYFQNDGEHLEKYRDDLIQAMRSGLFMYIAHPDIFFLVATEVTERFKKIAKSIIDAAIKYDVVFEINMHGFFRNHNRHNKVYIDYPCEYFWSEVAKTNIKVVVGGDFHDPSEIGSEFTKRKLSELLDKYHFNIVDIMDVYNDYQKRIKKL